MVKPPVIVVARIPEPGIAICCRDGLRSRADGGL